jgi:hypothetical protein
MARAELNMFREGTCLGKPTTSEAPEERWHMILDRRLTAAEHHDLRWRAHSIPKVVTNEI